MKGKTFTVVDGDISDGYHTFKELYDHRCLLFVRLCLATPDKAQWRHDYDGWFALYLDLPSGQISYHIPVELASMVHGKIKQIQGNPWDGHTSSDVIERLKCVR